MIRDHRRILWGSLFAASLAISIILFLTAPQKLVPTVLFFPTANNRGVLSEVHFLPRPASATEGARSLVESALAGPLSLKYKRLAPTGVRILGVFMTGQKIHVDLSMEFQHEAADCPLSPRERVDLLVKAFKYNSPNSLTLNILIEGKEIPPPFAVVGQKS